MDIKHQIKTLEFLQNLFEREKNNREDYRPQKPPLKPTETKNTFIEILPEQTGVYSEGLIELYKKISDTNGINPHSMLILKDGKMIAKAEWTPFRLDFPHVSHSLCKSIVSAAVGIAVSEGIMSLNETLGDWFKGYGRIPQEIKNLTVKSLLTMTSGIEFSEAAALTEKNWIRAFLGSEIKEKNVNEFSYNSLNTYMLTVMICQKTGGSLSKYLDEKLFTHMGITNYFWETCPLGYEKGGWGLYMSVYDYAKLGQLYLQNGKWNEKQLVPEKWIKESTSKKVSKVNTICNAGYGYQIWRTKNNDGFMFSGMFGQGVYVFPKRKIVIAMTAGSSYVYPQCKTMDIISSYISNDKNFSSQPIPEKHYYTQTAALRKSLSRFNYNEPMYLPSALSFLQLMRFNLTKINDKETLPATVKMLTSRRIIFEQNNSGLLPVLIQIMNGNFEHGIEQVYFGIKDGFFYTSVFGEGLVTQIPVSFDRQVLYFDIKRKGESYRVGTRGWFTSDEDGNPVLKIMLSFIETSSTKFMKLFFHEDHVILKLEESPELYSAIDEILHNTIPEIPQVLQKTVTAILESDIAEYKIKNILEPEIKGNFAQGEPPRKMRIK